MNERYVVESAAKDEWEDAMALAWRSFKKFVAENFQNTKKCDLTDGAYHKKIPR